MQDIIEKMKRIRSREDITLPKNKYLREEIDDGSGGVMPLSIRYYQVQGILHLVMINRFLLGDDTGLGKCVTEDTLIQTDKGLVRAGSLNPGIYDADTFADIEGVNVIVGKDSYSVKRFYYGGVKPTCWIRTASGFRIEGSRIHPVMTPDGWKPLQEITEGDKVRIHFNRYFPTKGLSTPICPVEVKHRSFGPQWSRYLGLLYGVRPDYDNTLPFRYAAYLTPLYIKTLTELTGVPKSEFYTLKTTIAPAIRDWWRSIGFCPTRNPNTIPEVILQGNRIVVKEFLHSFVAVRARSDRKNRSVYIEILDERMAQDIHLLLSKFGVNAFLKRHQGWSRIDITGSAIHTFNDVIGWWGNWQMKLAPPPQPRVAASHTYDKVVEVGVSEKVVVDIEVDHPSHTFIGDGVECHNTLQSIAASCYLWDRNPNMKVVVITIKSAVQQWAEEFERFTEGVKVFVSSGSPTKREKALSQFWEYQEGPSVLVMGYGAVLRDLEHYKDWDGYMLIIDEASAIKNHLTRTHKHIRYMSHKASRVVALTATMIENNLTEGWGIYNALVPGLFGNHSWFMNEFCVVKMMPVPKSNRKIPTILGYKRGAVDRFKEIIYPYFMGRSKLEVAKELPPLTRRTIYVGMSRVQRIKYQEALEGTLTVIKDGIEEEKETTKLSSIIYCQQIVDHPELIGVSGDSGKLDALMDLLTEGDLSDPGCKVIVFSRFKKMIDIIMEELEKAKIGAVRITGDENEMQREDAKKAFQNMQSDKRVICITTASRQGVNLQSAKAIVFYDTPWSAGDYLQLLGRMVRIGSKHDNVLAYHLVTRDLDAESAAERNTIDGHVLSTLSKKMNLVESVLGKRIKGDADEEIEVSPHNDISDLFEALRSDAEARKK